MLIATTAASYAGREVAGSCFDNLRASHSGTHNFSAGREVAMSQSHLFVSSCENALKPTVSEALTSQRATLDSFIVHVVFDANYAPMLTEFATMCEKHGLGRHLLALYLDLRPLPLDSVPSALRDSILTSPELALHVANWSLPGIGLYKHFDGPHQNLTGVKMSRFHSIGRVKLLFTALIASAGYSPLSLEIDVLLMRPPLLSFPSNFSGLVSFSCRNAAALSQLNLGLQVFPAPLPSWANDFLALVAHFAFRSGRWDQEAFNMLFVCPSIAFSSSRTRGRCEQFAPLIKLEACGYGVSNLNSVRPSVYTSGAADAQLELVGNGSHSLLTAEQWRESSVLPLFVHSVYLLGNAKLAATRSSIVALHLIGSASGNGFPGSPAWGYSKVQWAAAALAHDPAPARSSLRTGYVLLQMPFLLATTPLGTLHTRALELAVALGNALGRTPVIPIMPPSVAGRCKRMSEEQDYSIGVPMKVLYQASGGARVEREANCSRLVDHERSAHQALVQNLSMSPGPECYGLMDMRRCEGSFLPAPFLNGHLYVNRSLVPCRARVVGLADLMQAVMSNHSSMPSDSNASARSQPDQPARDRHRDRESLPCSEEEDLLVVSPDPSRMVMRSSEEALLLADHPKLLDALIRPKHAPSASWARAVLRAITQLPQQLRAAAEVCVQAQHAQLLQTARLNRHCERLTMSMMAGVV